MNNQITFGENHDIESIGFTTILNKSLEDRRLSSEEKLAHLEEKFKNSLRDHGFDDDPKVYIENKESFITLTQKKIPGMNPGKGYKIHDA